MITLPTKFQTGFNSASAVCYFIDISLLNLGVPNHLYISNQPGVSFTYGGSAVTAQTSYLAGSIINNGQEQAVDGLGEIDFSFDPTHGGTLASINTTSIILLNQGSFVSSHSYDFENQPIKIYKTFATTGSSLTAETDMLRIFDGVIVQAGSYDNTQFQIEAIDRRAKDIELLPQNNVNLVTYPHADKNALNKFIPIVFGDFGNLNNVTVSGLSGYQRGVLFAVPTIITDIYQNKAYASDAPYSITGNVFITDDSSKYIAVLTGSGTAIQYAISSEPNSLTSIGICANYVELWTKPASPAFRTDVYTTPPGQSIFGVAATWIKDFGNAVDEDPTTYIEVDLKYDFVGLSAFVNKFLQTKLVDFTDPGTFLTRYDVAYAYDMTNHNVDFYFGGMFEFVGGATGGAFGTSDFEGYMMDANNVNSHKRWVFDDHPQNSPFVQEWPLDGQQGVPGVGGKVYGGNWSTSDMGTMTWPLMKNRLIFGIGPAQPADKVVGDDGTKKLRIYHLWVRARTRTENVGIERTARFVPIWTTQLVGDTSLTLKEQSVKSYGFEVRGEGISNLYVPAQGPKFTQAMTAGSGHTTVDIIKDPAHVIEYLLRYKCGLSGDEMGATASRIDRASFNAVGSTTGSRSAWSVAVSMIERKSVYDYIQEICKEFHMSLVLTQDGRYRAVSHDPGTSVYTVTASDIFFDGYPQIAVAMTTNDAIYNDIALNYQFDYTTSKPRATTYVSDTGFTGNLYTNLSNQTGALRDTTYIGWLQDSQQRYGGTTRELKIDSKYIQDQTTAELSLKKFCDWLAFKRLIVTMKLVPTLNTMSLELGDQIKISNSILTALFSNSALFMITGINNPPVNTTTDAFITVTCIEIPSTNSGTPILTNRFISSDDLAHGT